MMERGGSTQQMLFIILMFYLNALFNPLSTNITKWSNTLKHFVGKLQTNCLSVFDHFVGLTLKGLTHVETDSQCKSTAWFLYDGNNDLKLANTMVWSAKYL